MAPVYQGYKRHFRLQEDDIEAIQSLYGQYLCFDVLIGLLYCCFECSMLRISY